MYRGRGVRYGTGFLIHPRVVLTAGHNVAYYPSGVVKKADLYFGSIDSTKFRKHQKVDLRRNKTKFFKSNYFLSNNIKRDFAVIILPDESVYESVGGHFTLKPNNEIKYDSLTITGSPGDKDLFEIWTETTDDYKEFRDYTKYNLHTVKRNSGSPIWFADENGDFQVTGIHSRGYGSCGASVKITDRVYEQIKKWCAKAGINLDKGI